MTKALNSDITFCTENGGGGGGLIISEPTITALPLSIEEYLVQGCAMLSFHESLIKMYSLAHSASGQG